MAARWRARAQHTAARSESEVRAEDEERFARDGGALGEERHAREDQ